MAPHVRETDNRQEAIEELEKEDGWEDQIEALNQKFYAYPEDLTELLFEYVSARPETFGEISVETVRHRPSAIASAAPEPSWWKKLFGKS